MRNKPRPLVAAAAATTIVAAAGCASAPHSSTSLSSSAGMPAICARTGPDVFAVSGRQNSPAPVLTSTMQAAAFKAIGSGAAIGLVDVDGAPHMVAAAAFSDPTAGNSYALNQDKANFLGQIASAVSAIRAAHPHVNVLEALDVAARAIRGACADGGTVYIADSGLQDVGPVNFQQPGTLEASPADVVAFLTREHELPDLKGIAVVLIGFGDTAAPQPPLSISQRTNLIAIWSAIARTAGATSVRVDPAPRSGAAPAHVPPVSAVPVPAELSWGPADNSFAFPDSGPVGFEPNTAVFRDPPAAEAALEGLANYMTANPSVKIQLTGTTAHWGTLESDITLSMERSNAVKAVLVQLGVSPSQINISGVGWEFPGYQDDQGPDGTLLPGPAEHNRSVIVTKL